MKTPRFTYNPRDVALINKIAKRACDVYAKHGDQRPLLDIQMDLSACHVTNPLRLADLLAADDFNLMHDVDGIYRHLDRETGKLNNHFLPRFTKK
jgi:hypothetical protein